MLPTQDHLILASSSPRRAQLLREKGYTFEIRIPVIDEPVPRSSAIPPAHWAEALSYYKARSVSKHLQSGYVLAADTLVALKSRIFGKPRDAEEAGLMLRILMGTSHQVITGVSLLDVRGDRRLIRHDTSAVTMRRIPDAEIEQYLQTDLWQGKAGAYGIQDESDVNIESLSGSYSNVMGLPMELVESMFTEMGIVPLAAAPSS